MADLKKETHCGVKGNPLVACQGQYLETTGGIVTEDRAMMLLWFEGEMPSEAHGNTLFSVGSAVGRLWDP